MSILDKPVSYFPSVTETTKGVVTSLLTILKSDKHKQMVLNLRASPEEIQKQLKVQSPCYTIAGTFSTRSAEGLIQLSGLAAVDLDSAENYDTAYLLNELKKIDSIAYAGHSISGLRLFCIIPFRYPEKYQQHYERLIRSFMDMGLPMGDECHKSISQPRFVSWNDNTTQLFRHDAKPYGLLPPERTYHIFERESNQGGTHVRTEQYEQKVSFTWCKEQTDKSRSFTEGSRHDYLVHLARYCNLKGVPQEETLKGCLSFVAPDFDEKEVSKIVHHVYTKQADSHNTIPFTPKKKQSHRKNKTEATAVKHPVQAAQPSDETSEKKNLSPENFDQQIAELESFFNSITLPAGEIQLNAWTKITDVPQFVDSHLATLKAHPTAPSFASFLSRLNELKNFLSSL